LFDYKPEFKGVFSNSINENEWGQFSYNTQSIQVYFWNLSPEQIRSEILSVFKNYSYSHIFFDAIENIMEHDRSLFSEIIQALSQNKVKIFLSSRQPIKGWDTLTSILVEKFNRAEANDFIHINMPTLEKEHQEFILNLVRYEKDEIEKFDPIMLTLLYSLFQSDETDLIFLIEQLKTQTQVVTVFVFGDESVWRHDFHREVERLILQKLFHHDKALLTYFNKTYILKYHEKDAEYLAGVVSDTEWKAFEKFAIINGRVIRNSITLKLQWALHDSLYLIIGQYFLSEYQKSPDVFSQYSNIYYTIIDYWKDHRLEIWVRYEYISEVVRLCHNLWYNSKDQEKYAWFLGSVGYEFSSFWKYQEAITLHNKAIDIHHELLKNAHYKHLLLNKIATVFGNLGVALYSIWNYQEAIEQYHKALNILLSLHHNKDSNNQSLLNEIATVYNNLWWALKEIWKNQEAIEQYHKALDIQLMLLEKDPSNCSLLKEIATVYSNWWWALQQLWNYQEAIGQYHKALDIRLILLEKDSHNHSLLNEIASIYINWGSALHETWNYQEAIGQYHKALDIRLMLLEQDSYNQSLQSLIASIYLNLGVTLFSLWNYQETIKQYHKALNILLSLYKKDSNNDSLLYQIANTYGNMSQVSYVLWQNNDADMYWHNASKNGFWIGREFLELELQFYHYAHHTNSIIRFEAFNRLQTLLDEWINSHWWDLKANIKKAIQDGHPDRATLVELATRISVNIDYSEFLE